MTVTAEYAIELGRQVDELEAENAKLLRELDQARTLIMSASLYMPFWSPCEGRESWMQDSEKWLKRLEE